MGFTALPVVLAWVYPRVYGETSTSAECRKMLCPKRSIPACTGKPQRQNRRSVAQRRKVYPRVYGETLT